MTEGGPRVDGFASDDIVKKHTEKYTGWNHSGYR